MADTLPILQEAAFGAGAVCAAVGEPWEGGGAGGEAGGVCGAGAGGGGCRVGGDGRKVEGPGAPAGGSRAASTTDGIITLSIPWTTRFLFTTSGATMVASTVSLPICTAPLQ